jgi:hypothetical protein
MNVCAAVLSRKLGRLKCEDFSNRRMDVDDGEGELGRMESDENGVSMEGEFTFSTVEEFLQVEVRMGNFKGNYVLNLRDQLRAQSLEED